MKTWSACALTLVFHLLAAPAAHADLPEDVGFASLLRDAMARNSDLEVAREQIQAARQRAPQVSNLPDPMVSLGYQNDGFTSLPWGTMPTTYFALMVTQSIPYPGKREARVRAADAGVALAQARIGRLTRSLEADVARGYVGLLLARGQLRLLDAQDALWKKAEALARTRYEVGQGSQTDVLRAQLQRTRLRQAQVAAQTEVHARRIELNRLALRPLDADVATPQRLEDLPLPTPLPDAVTMTLQQSPDLALAELAVQQAGRRVELAQIESKPDLAVTAGLMPRGRLEPMWQLALSTSLPLHAGVRREHAVAEGQHQRAAESQAAEGLRQTLVWRTQERQLQLAAALETCKLYMVLLAQSEATLRSSLSQYGVGRLPFAAVLEAMGGQLGDEGAYLAALAQAQALGIALAEMDPGPTRTVNAAGAMASPSMPGAAGGASRSAASSMAAASAGSEAGAGGSM